MRRKSVTSSEELVRTRAFETGPLPLVVEPAVPGVELKSWAGARQEWLDQQLHTHGGVLFRGFDIGPVERFEEVMRAVWGDLLDYSYRSTPRTQVSGKVYTSTEYPADQSIPMHNEQSYTRNWPMRIAFYSVKCAETGGETPIADSRRVLQRLDPALVRRFEEKGVMYVRNYGSGLDLSWQNVFQTEDPADVEAFCRRSGIEFEWRPNGGLRTRQVCQGVETHPVTGERVWFNQAHLFHISSVPSPLRERLLADLAADELPRNTFYGDGTPIEDETLAQIRAAFDAEEIAFPWEQGDLLMLDNMLAAHARKPFSGTRRVVVGMAKPQGSGPAPAVIA
jgi:alpha-ketoglutarate-dependent taurine dioxygenase